MQLGQVYATYNWRENQGVEKFRYCPLCGTELTRKPVDQKTRPLCPHCGFIYYRNPFPTVSVLVIQNQEVLLGKRLGEPGKGKWAVPSGYIEFEDDFLTAAIREVKEETGLEIELLSILNVQSAFLPPEYHFLGVYLLADVLGGKLQAGDDLERVDWFSLSGPLPEMAFPPDVQIMQACSNGTIEGLPVQPYDY
jgi:ADP-ribose pyrophosphatase YjhB (NUDIX family)